MSGLDAGEYLVLVRPLAGTAVVGPNPRPVTIEPGAETTLDIELSGDPTGPVITVAEARAAIDAVQVEAFAEMVEQVGGQRRCLVGHHQEGFAALFAHQRIRVFSLGQEQEFDLAAIFHG